MHQPLAHASLRCFAGHCQLRYDTCRHTPHLYHSQSWNVCAQQHRIGGQRALFSQRFSQSLSLQWPGSLPWHPPTQGTTILHATHRSQMSGSLTKRSIYASNGASATSRRTRVFRSHCCPCGVPRHAQWHYWLLWQLGLRVPLAPHLFSAFSVNRDVQVSLGLVS